jgi:hypothetical protein
LTWKYIFDAAIPTLPEGRGFLAEDDEPLSMVTNMRKIGKWL